MTATDADDKLLAFASHGSFVAVAAPGADIVVAAPGAGYDFTTGTSVATAHVSGIAALLLARNGSLTPDAVQAILMKTATGPRAPGARRRVRRRPGRRLRGAADPGLRDRGSDRHALI